MVSSIFDTLDYLFNRACSRKKQLRFPSIVKIALVHLKLGCDSQVVILINFPHLHRWKKRLLPHQRWHERYHKDPADVDVSRGDPTLSTMTVRPLFKSAQKKWFQFQVSFFPSTFWKTLCFPKPTEADGWSLHVSTSQDSLGILFIAIMVVWEDPM